MKMTRYCLISLLALALFPAKLAGQGYLQEEFDWAPEALIQADSTILYVPTNAQTYWSAEDMRPYWQTRIPLGISEEIEIDPSVFFLFDRLDPAVYRPYIEQVSKQIRPVRTEVSVSYVTERKQRFAVISVPMLELEDNQALILTHLTLRWNKVARAPQLAKKGPSWKTESLLKSGSWLKLILSESGIYRMSVSDLEKFGLAVSGQEISKIRMYGYSGGMLPEANIDTRYDDLEEMAIEVRDKNSNGLFDGNDDVLFFAYDAHQVIYNPSSQTYYRQIHYYSNQVAVFVTIGQPGGKRISSRASSGQSPDYVTSSFDAIMHFEEEKYSLVKSGKEWYGPEFGKTVSSVSQTINLPGQVPNEDILLQTRALARSSANSTLQVSVNGQQVHVHPLGTVDIEQYWAQFATTPTIARTGFQANSPLNITFDYTKPTPNALAWLDYFELVYRRRLSGGTQYVVRESRGINPGAYTRYNLEGLGYEVWDLSDPLNIEKIQVNLDGANQYFVDASNVYKEYAVCQGENYLKVTTAELVENQNIHGNHNIDYVIVSPPEFLSEAKRLAEYHQQHNNLNTLVVEPVKIYNEFSSGVPDISAIRNMMRYFYETADPGKEPRFLLLFGDASYDYKNIKGNNSNFVPTYQSVNSLSPIGSFCSDDFYGLLDEDEGGNVTGGNLDLGIGRLPIQSQTQAREMVDKIIRYHSKDGLGDWRNLITIVTDDGDNNIHMHDGMIYSDTIENSYKSYNVRKVFADSYRQTTVGTGQRYPDVVKEIDRAFSDGALIVNYSGHGGEIQLGDERYVEIPQILGWKNGHRMPLFVTATCEFTRFDDPDKVSAGEHVILNPQGGAIGLLTTTRLVFQSPNRALNNNLYSGNVFSYPAGQAPTIGEVFMRTKNKTQGGVNNRSFTYLGDPAIVLAYPRYDVVTTRVNDQEIDQFSDTILALSTLKIEGEIRDDQNQIMSGFNGTVHTTVFAAKQTVTTLANDADSYAQEFQAYRSIIYKGKASVKNGKFVVTFIVPRDLPFAIGEAKISYYAENGDVDANGYQFLAMSPDISPDAAIDLEGPKIRLYMNDSFFVFGGYTNESPYIYALVYDESGINTTGLGIGRDITATLNYESNKQIILNEYYDADTNDFTRGTVYYQLRDLSEGRHHLKLKVWDVHNNSSEATTEFIVANSIEFAIHNLVSYPNPFTHSTTLSFEHNHPGKHLSMEVQIYDQSGKLVTTLVATEDGPGSRVTSLVWSPRDGAINLVSPGLYTFVLVVSSEDGQEARASARVLFLPTP